MVTLDKINLPTEISEAVLTHKNIGRIELETYSLTSIDAFNLSNLNYSEGFQVQDLLIEVFSHHEMQEHHMVVNFSHEHSISRAECPTLIVEGLDQPGPISAMGRLQSLLEYSSKNNEPKNEWQSQFAQSSKKIKSWLDSYLLESPVQSYAFSLTKDYVDHSCVVALNEDHVFVMCYSVDH